MPMSRTLNSCWDCAYACEAPGGGSVRPDSAGVVYCFRRRVEVAANTRCGLGLPLKVASGRLRKRKGHNAQI